MDPSNKFVEVDRWKEYFDNTGKDVFEVIEFAIKVAYRFHPAGLLQHRCNLAQHLFAGFNNDNEDSDDDFDEPVENSEVIQPNENIIGDSNNGECQEKRHILRIKLKHPGENVRLSSPKEEEKLNNAEKDLAKKSSELDKNQKHRNIATRKADSQDQAKMKTGVQFLGPKKGKKIRHVNQERSKSYVSGKGDHKIRSMNEKSPSEAIKNGQEEIFKSLNQRPNKSFESCKNPMLPSTITKLPIQYVEAKFCDEAKIGERKLEGGKRKLEDRYKDLDTERKKLRTILKETRTPNEGVGGCGKYYRRHVVYRIRRTMA